MIDTVINQARLWGFSCGQNNQDWQIFPRDTSKSWFLEQREERWILIVRGVPQIYFHPSEAIAFLELRYRDIQQEKVKMENINPLEE
ncbi:MAG: hypothetical protein AAGA60_01700 [Cyanobacteria bacterium P01_E01_bin.42]